MFSLSVVADNMRKEMRLWQERVIIQSINIVLSLIRYSVKVRTKEDDEHIYKRDTEWLRSSDVLIAECTNPSHGVGYELAYAEARNIPVHIFYDKRKANISAMLNGNAYFKVYPYENEAEIYPVLDKILDNKQGDLIEKNQILQRFGGIRTT